MCCMDRMFKDLSNDVLQAIYSPANIYIGVHHRRLFLIPRPLLRNVEKSAGYSEG